MVTRNKRWSSSGFDFLCYTLVFLAALTFIVATILAIQQLANWPDTAAAQNAVIATARGYFVGGLLTAAALLALAAIVHLMILQIRAQRTQQTTNEQIRDALLQLQDGLRNPVPTGTPVPDHVATEHAPHFGEHQVLRLLEQLRDFSLMDQRQHEQWAKRHWEERKNTLMRQMDRAIAAAQWDSAAAYIADLRHILPEDPLIPQFQERLVQEKANRLRVDIEAAQSRLQHFISIAAWTQAEEVLAGLNQRYPGNPDVQFLADQLQEERARLESEQIQRMMVAIKDASDRRLWRQAINIIEEIKSKYPQHTQAELLQLDLPRLRTNAEAQERREEENLFKDLLHRHRYEEALAVAQRVMVKHPASPTAQEMSKLLPKIQEFLQKRKQISRGHGTMFAASGEG